MKKICKLLALTLALAMLCCMFAGCAAKPAATEDKPSGDSQQTTQDTPAASGAVLRAALIDEIVDYNPFVNQQTIYLCFINNNVMEPLLYINEKNEYVPSLAASWDISDDALTYTFHLREGVKFHDGSAFSAEDVKYTLEYTKDEANGCWRAGYFASVSEITCPDEHTLVLQLSAPTPALLDSLSSMAIVSAKQDPATYSTVLNGTGPFRFASAVTNDSMTFEKNADWWDAANVKLDGFVLKYFADESTEITSLQAGDVDLIYNLSAMSAGTVAGSSGLKVVTSPTSNSTYLFEIGKHNVEAFQNEDVLKAMFMCLDTETIANQVFYGYASASTGVVHPGAKYFKSVYDTTYDVDAAKALLATTPYADGFEFTLNCLQGGAFEAIGIIWQQDLAKIGIKLNVSVEEMSVWLDHYLSRDYDMIANSYSMVGTDPATMMTLIIASLYDYQASEAIIPGLSALIDEAATTADETKRAELYGQIFDLLAEKMPVYTYLCVDNLYGANEKLNNVCFTGESRYIFSYATLG